jgi:hypothetical protein
MKNILFILLLVILSSSCERLNLKSNRKLENLNKIDIEKEDLIMDTIYVCDKLVLEPILVVQVKEDDRTKNEIQLKNVNFNDKSKRPVKLKNGNIDTTRGWISYSIPNELKLKNIYTIKVKNFF